MVGKGDFISAKLGKSAVFRTPVIHVQRAKIPKSSLRRKSGDALLILVSQVAVPCGTDL